MRVNLLRPFHVKTLASQKRRALLTAHKLLQKKAIAIENDVRGLLRNFGLKVGIVGAGKFEERIRDVANDMPELYDMMNALLPTPLAAIRQHALVAQKPTSNSQISNRLRALTSPASFRP